MSAWDTMEPRERDAEIAVRLFVWRWMLQCGSGGTPQDRVALFPPEAPGRVIFNLASDAEDVTDRHWHYPRFSDWDRMSYREAGDSLHVQLRGLPHYTTDAAADYLVLQRVRETWDVNLLSRLRRFVESLWRRRIVGGGMGLVLQYTHGDYSHAAYLALATSLDSPTGESE